MKSLYKFFILIIRRIVFHPLEIGLLIISAIEIFDICLKWLGITYLSNIVKIIDIKSTASIIGFIDGITPFASWRNCKLWIAMFSLSGAFIIPFISSSIGGVRLCYLAIEIVF